MEQAAAKGSPEMAIGAGDNLRYAGELVSESLAHLKPVAMHKVSR